jgi:Mg2+ and Co2+ transporter CorA
LEEGRVLKVLEWLRDLLATVANNPDLDLIEQALKELEDNRDVVLEALMEAVEDEYKPYIERIVKSIAGEVAKATGRSQS